MTHRPFWRASPIPDADVCVPLNAVHIRGWSVEPGEVLAEPDLIPGMLEWYRHEVLHLMTGTSQATQFQRTLTFALYQALYHVAEQELLVSLPSWRIQGQPALSEWFERAWGILNQVDEATRDLEEIVSTFQTVMYYWSQGELDTPRGARILATIESNSTADVWHRVSLLREQPWLFKLATPSPLWDDTTAIYGLATSVALQIAQICLHPPRTSVSSWWISGEIEESSCILRHFDEYVTSLSAVGSVDEAYHLMIERIGDVGAQLRGRLFLDTFTELVELDHEVESDELKQRRQNNPLVDLLGILGTGIEDFATKEPVGRGLMYLVIGGMEGDGIDPSDGFGTTICVAQTEGATMRPQSCATAYLTDSDLEELSLAAAPNKSMYEGMAAYQALQARISRPPAVSPPPEVEILFALQSILEQVAELGYRGFWEYGDARISLWHLLPSPVGSPGAAL